MPHKFLDGQLVAHNLDTFTPMSVIGYTGEGKVNCRWKDKSGRFQNLDFLEAELEAFVDTPSITSGRLTAGDDMEFKSW